MARRVVITGLGPISGLGVGIDPIWAAMREGRSAIGPITMFDPAGFACTLGAEVRDFKVNAFVPKSYRKAVKVMARDIELAVAAADLAARDAKLITKGTAPEPPAGQAAAATTYPPQRVGAHIGAGLIACELTELTEALDTARKTQDPTQFDYHKWGAEGIAKLNPLWLLKYLPNMLACHVTIIHDAQGPSNTITCAEASSGLSIGESLRVIQRGAADACFCGGTESKLNPMAFLRQVIAGRLNTTSNADPGNALRPFAPDAAGTIVGEGGAIIIMEAEESFKARGGTKAYAALKGFGASQSIHPESRNFVPDPAGRGIALAVKNALRDAGVSADEIDLIIGFGCGIKESDASEMAAYRTIFGERLASIPIQSIKPLLGNCGAGTGGIDAAIAAKAVEQQQLPLGPAKQTAIRNVLSLSISLGGQNAALVIGRA
jgi:3-oxoacyl-[acyl-carrier-protein] synthase II